MTVDNELDKLIRNYVKKLEEKEGVLLSAKKEIEKIINDSKKQLFKIIKNLDSEFNLHKIDEKEYMSVFLSKKETVQIETVQKLDVLIKKNS